MLRTAEPELKRQVERLMNEADAARQATRFQQPPFHAWMTQVELLISGLGNRGDVFARQVAAIREGKTYRELIHSGLRGGQLSAMPAMMVDGVQGILAAIRHAVDNGLLTAVEDRLASEIHGDVLTEAATLLDAGHLGARRF
jgi:hypothetical protein